MNFYPSYWRQYITVLRIVLKKDVNTSFVSKVRYLNIYINSSNSSFHDFHGPRISFDGLINPIKFSNPQRGI